MANGDGKLVLSVLDNQSFHIQKLLNNYIVIIMVSTIINTKKITLICRSIKIYFRALSYIPITTLRK